MQERLCWSHPINIPVLGLPVHLLDDYDSWLGTRLRQSRAVMWVTLNAEMRFRQNTMTMFSQHYPKAELVIPDGSGVILYLCSTVADSVVCPGIELAESAVRQAGKD
jgi:N-acetylglucosaminyldiphosphoundecaprenol N-acetyl-beta-D-mannosaminyltransferase